MAVTYTPIATNTVTTATASYTFSSIPSTYTDLILVSSVRSTSTSLDYGPNIQLNSDTGSNYSYTYIDGNGSAATSGRSSNNTILLGGNSIPYSSSATGAFAISTVHFQNYSNTTTYKTAITRFNDVTTSDVLAAVNLWRNTSAINSIKVFLYAGNIAVGSSFTLYGIKAA